MLNWTSRFRSREKWCGIRPFSNLIKTNYVILGAGGLVIVSFHNSISTALYKSSLKMISAWICRSSCFGLTTRKIGPLQVNKCMPHTFLVAKTRQGCVQLLMIHQAFFNHSLYPQYVGTSRDSSPSTLAQVVTYVIAMHHRSQQQKMCVYVVFFITVDQIPV